MPIATLDYPKTKLVMEFTNPVEQEYRLKAVTKEPWTVAFIESAPAGAIFWDIGANVGPYTLVAVAHGLSVLAIEPSFANYATLCRNLGLNNMLDRCTALCLALGETTRFDWMHYQDTRSGAASHTIGGERTKYFHRQRIWVWAWDQLAGMMGLPADVPWYAKIDVDGNEITVLKGASQVLRQMQGVMIEMRADQEEAITALLVAAGLKLAERFAERGGKPMPGLAYGRFERG